MRDYLVYGLKRQLADAILSSVVSLNVTIAARVLDIDASRLSDLRGGRIERFSIEWLIGTLANVDRSVTVTVVTHSRPELAWFRVLRERYARRRMHREFGTKD